MLRNGSDLGRKIQDSVQSILFIDGDCLLCSRLARLVLRCDRHHVHRLATLQGLTFRRLHIKEGLLNENTIVYWLNDKAYTRSAAVIRVLGRMGPWWKMIYVLLIIPRPLRDAVYNFVARNRHRWFGRQPHCGLADKRFDKYYLD